MRVIGSQLGHRASCCWFKGQRAGGASALTHPDEDGAKQCLTLDSVVSMRAAGVVGDDGPRRVREADGGLSRKALGRRRG